MPIPHTRFPSVIKWVSGLRTWPCALSRWKRDGRRSLIWKGNILVWLLGSALHPLCVVRQISKLLHAFSHLWNVNENSILRVPWVRGVHGFMQSISVQKRVPGPMEVFAFIVILSLKWFHVVIFFMTSR